MIEVLKLKETGGIFMDKFLEIICKQNPQITLSCGNEKCGTKFTEKTIDVCKAKEYKHICDKCGETTTYYADKMFDNAIKQLKAMGVTAK